VWPSIEHTFVEYDPFCQAILKKHYPNSTIHGDIRTFIADTERDTGRPWGSEREGQFRATAFDKHNRQATTNTEREGRERELRDAEGQHRLRDRSGEDEKPFILTGGFPCQPFSVAGRRQGTDDHRYLWPEMFRVIQLYKPTWVIAENVRGLTTWNEGLVLETVCTDLEGEGYEVQPFIIPACAVGAPHRRERVWIVANRRRERREQRPDQNLRPESEKPKWANDSFSCSEWHRDWREVALTTCHDGVDDGLPRQMDGATISGARHRKERLKACGNAIVPQVAEKIMRAIMERDNNMNRTLYLNRKPHL